MSRLAAIAPLVLFAALALALAAGVAMRDRAPRGGTLVGQTAPEFSLPGLDLEEGGLERADLAGAPALVNVFASWCAPCRVEHPRLMALAAEGAPIYGVVWRDAPAAARGFLDELGQPYAAIGIDRGGRWGEAWAVSGAPETFLIGADGVVAAHWRGPLTARDIDQVIRPALGL